MKKYQLWFDFTDTEEQAKRLVEKNQREATRYMAKKHPSHYTPWSSEDGTENKFIVWSYR